MPNINITMPELVWPGKYDENGNLFEVDRPRLPFQKIETVNDTVTNRRKKDNQLTLFDLYIENTSDTVGSDWKNKLIWGDNKYVMSSLLANYTGKIDLIYIDPPFDVGADFSVKTEIGDYEITKEPSIIEQKAYRDTWGQGVNSYLHMLYERLCIMRDLLSDKGSIYVHLDWHVGQYVKVILDEIFGKENFRNEIVWCYTSGGKSRKMFSRKHDNIFFYSKSDNYIFNDEDIRIPYSQKTIDNYKEGLKGSTYTSDVKLNELGKIPEDYWDIAIASKSLIENLGYPTQKPEKLLERIIKASSNKDSIVADFFVGSGTSVAVAEKLGRQWIASDLSRFSIHTTRKRLMEIEGCRPFEILNMGKYERKYWQGISFDKVNDSDEKEMIVYYLKFILDLYNAEPLTGFDNIHGKKGRALIHIGAVDAPVTMDEVYAALKDCKQAGRNELHILGWEWEMGMNNPIIIEARAKYDITLRLINIPREVMDKRAVEAGDVQFFDLAYLETEIETDKKDKKTIRINLKNFAIPDTELIPDEVRAKIKKWSDYIDYWAVDWNFMNDTFVNQWQTYRTRQNRKLELTSEWHTYEKRGYYQILIKVVDIFGNDTSHLIEVDVK